MPRYQILNMSQIKGKEKTFNVLDIAIVSKNICIKRCFVSDDTYKTLLKTFKDEYDMINFSIGDYITIQPNYKGEIDLALFEEKLNAELK